VIWQVLDVRLSIVIEAIAPRQMNDRVGPAHFNQLSRIQLREIASNRFESGVWMQCAPAERDHIRAAVGQGFCDVRSDVSGRPRYQNFRHSKASVPVDDAKERPVDGAANGS
jgi:hypothetical protein